MVGGSSFRLTVDMFVGYCVVSVMLSIAECVCVVEVVQSCEEEEMCLWCQLGDYMPWRVCLGRSFTVNACTCAFTLTLFVSWLSRSS